MTPPTVEEGPDRIVVRKRSGGDGGAARHPHRGGALRRHPQHGEAAALENDGVEAALQEALAAAPEWCGEGFRLVRREWATGIGPVDLVSATAMTAGSVEIKRVGSIDAVEQPGRYLVRIRLDPAMAACRGVLAAQVVKPRVSSPEARGIAWVEVDLEVLRGEREPDVTLFAA